MLQTRKASHKPTHSCWIFPFCGKTHYPTKYRVSYSQVFTQIFTLTSKNGILRVLLWYYIYFKDAFCIKYFKIYIHTPFLFIQLIVRAVSVIIIITFKLKNYLYWLIDVIFSQIKWQFFLIFYFWDFFLNFHCILTTISYLTISALGVNPRTATC